MEVENIKAENALYDPVQFVFAGFIGAGKTAEETCQYKWAHRDIVRPPPGHPLINYVLFHTAAIYNWIKEVRPPEVAELDRYIQGLQSQNNSKVTSKSLQEQLAAYAARWEVVRLCFEAQFFIERASCKHLARRVVWTSSYSFKWKTKELGLDKFYCKDCRSWSDVEKAELKTMPEVVMLSRFEKDVALNGNDYDLYYVLTSSAEKEFFVRIAGGTWYRVSPKGVVLASAQIVQSLKAEKYFYCRRRPEELPGKVTTSMQVYVAPSIQLEKKLSKGKKPIESSERIEKVPPTTSIPPAKSPQPLQQPTERKGNVFLQPLYEEAYEPATYSELPRFRKSIEKSYQTEKKKDEYDIEYDRGKVKKVRNRLINKHIDFNELARKVKLGLINKPEPKKKEPKKPAWPDRDDLQ